MAERFSPRKIEEEGERTQTGGLPLFEWARSERVREEGRAALREEMEKDAPDYGYVADIAGMLVERFLQPSAAAAREAPPQEVVREYAAVVSVGTAVRDIAAQDWQYGSTRFAETRDHFSSFDVMIAGSMRTLDPERFDREVPADVRERLWQEAMRMIEDRRNALPLIQLMGLEKVLQLDPERFTREVNVAGGEWASLRDAIGGMLADEPSRAIYAAASAKHVFGPDALAPHAEHIAHQWAKWRDLAQVEMQRDPSAIWMMAKLQEVAPEGKDAPCPTHEQWVAARARLEHPWEPPTVRFGHLASLVHLQVAA